MTRLKVTGIHDVKVWMADLPKLMLDDFEKVFRKRGPQFAASVRRHFGAETGPGVPGGQLKVRSGDAVAGISHEVTRDGNKSVTLRFGLLNTDPDVQEYFETQEIGRHITPKYAPKLAFPPGDAGDPIRDARGVQQFWLGQAMRELSSDYYFLILENIVLGRRHGQRDMEVMFIRADSVDIPARAPVVSELASAVGYVLGDVLGPDSL